MRREIRALNDFLKRPLGTLYTPGCSSTAARALHTPLKPLQVQVHTSKEDPTLPWYNSESQQAQCNAILNYLQNRRRYFRSLSRRSWPGNPSGCCDKGHEPCGLSGKLPNGRTSPRPVALGARRNAATSRTWGTPCRQAQGNYC